MILGKIAMTLNELVSSVSKSLVNRPDFGSNTLFVPI